MHHIIIQSIFIGVLQLLDGDDLNLLSLVISSFWNVRYLYGKSNQRMPRIWLRWHDAFMYIPFLSGGGEAKTATRPHWDPRDGKRVAFRKLKWPDTPIIQERASEYEKIWLTCRSVSCRFSRGFSTTYLCMVWWRMLLPRRHGKIQLIGGKEEDWRILHWFVQRFFEIMK